MTWYLLLPFSRVQIWKLNVTLPSNKLAFEHQSYSNRVHFYDMYGTQKKGLFFPYKTKIMFVTASMHVCLLCFRKRIFKNPPYKNVLFQTTTLCCSLCSATCLGCVLYRVYDNYKKCV